MSFMSRKMPHPRTVYPDQPRGICRVCKHRVKAKRRRFFCSSECARLYSAVGNWNITRRLVGSRDKYCCKLCGVNLKELSQRWKDLRDLLPHAIWIAVGKLMRGRKGSVTKSWWECDHIDPMIAAKRRGESPDHSLTNLRVICCRCHDVRKLDR